METGTVPGREESVRLSTGETVTLPLTVSGSVYGVALTADREGVADLLPAGLEPVPVRPGRAAVVVLSVSYDRIGDGEIDPYEEVGVVLPAVEASASRVPYASVLSGGFGGYVWYLPVTTEPARALGVDVWGYPKTVADVSHVPVPSGRRTTVTADGTHVLTVEVSRPPTVRMSTTARSYAVRDGELLTVPVAVDAEFGAWPYSGAASVTVGDHPRAERLADLAPGARALVRLFADGEFTFYPGTPVEQKEPRNSGEGDG